MKKKTSNSWAKVQRECIVRDNTFIVQVQVLEIQVMRLPRIYLPSPIINTIYRTKDLENYPCKKSLANSIRYSNLFSIKNYHSIYNTTLQRPSHTCRVSSSNTTRNRHGKSITGHSHWILRMESWQTAVPPSSPIQDPENAIIKSQCTSQRQD